MKSADENKPSLMIAGGGTGGHVLAGVAVADAWRAKYGPDAKIIFVGAEGGIEEKLVPRAGYPLKLLRLGSLKSVPWKKRFKTLAQLPLSLLKSLSILIQERPTAVLGVGGYASGPLVLMARFFSKTAILEQNSVPGFTNRILGGAVHQVFCAFPGTEKQFSAKSAMVTGNPVRSAIQRLGPAKPEPFCVFIFGGSLGALGINSLVIEALPLLEDLKGKIRWIHQTGEKDFERVKAAHEKFGTQARVEKFIFDMKSAYEEASLLICRAGSSTLSEIAAAGRPAILIPFPQASDNHQEKNARIFSEQGAARLLIQGAAKGSDLAQLVREFLKQPTELQKMEREVVKFYRPRAATDIVEALSPKNG